MTCTTRAIALPRTVATRAAPRAPTGLGHSASVNYRRAQLTALYLAGMPYRLIALEYGGTADGVRSTVRKMRERGALPDRPQPRPREWA